MIETILYVALAPLAAFFLGCFFEGFERKMFARFQNRIGPPLLQPLYDVLKLFEKETLVPEKGNRLLFAAAPMVSFAAVCSIIVVLPFAGQAALPFTGDLVVLVYLLILSTFGFLLGAASSGNPFSAAGASRELTLLLSVELPLALVVLSVATFSHSFSLLSVEHSLVFVPGMIVFFAAIMVELGRTPFEVDEARTEIVGGTLTEYSGRLLGVFKATKAMKLFALTNLFVVLFLDLPPGFLAGLVFQLAAALFLVFLIALVRAVFPRYRIHDASKSLFTSVLLLALLQMVLVF